MIGTPRNTVMMVMAIQRKIAMDDILMIAQRNPSTVERANAPTVTCIVIMHPCSRIGRKSFVSVRNCSIGIIHKICKNGHADYSRVLFPLLLGWAGVCIPGVRSSAPLSELEFLDLSCGS